MTYRIIKENKTMNMQEATSIMKADSYKMAALSEDTRNNILAHVKDALIAHKDEIFAANAKDMAAAEENGIAASVKKRLKFDEHKLDDVTNGIDELIKLPDPVGQIQLKRELDEGLVLQRVSCPIGVIGIIFEARPDALVQISSLCIKSGNCAVLKGGKETANTNKALFDVIYSTAVANGAPEGCMLQASQHNEIDELLSCNKSVDLLIPRGSNAFVQYIMNNTKIPVMGHADGICHTYIDKDADIEKAIPIIIDAKTQYTAACNATETLLIHKDVAEEMLPAIAKALMEHGVKLRGTADAARIINQAEFNINNHKESTKANTADSNSAAINGKTNSGKSNSPADSQTGCEIMGDNDFNTEYLDLILSVKIVDDVQDAISHINHFGSHHTDCIVTENADTAALFMQLVDSAGVYQNCSTRFADGFRYGFGAEVGISTSKIHARGPVGLEGLVTYKYKLYGHGQIVDDYATGKKHFHFRDL